MSPTLKDLKEHPETQLPYLNSSFEENWNSPEAIRNAVNRVAEAQGLSEKLESAELQEIIHFAMKLGFEPVFSKNQSF